jgi:hypothetical protein
MNSQPPKGPGKGERGTGRPGGAPESPASNETFPRRTERPGDAGLANETRPGLGTRAADRAGSDHRENKKAVRQDHEPLGRNAPLPPRQPREQKPDSPAHERERDTGVSGHSGAD